MEKHVTKDLIPADSWIPITLDLLAQGKQVKVAPHGFSMYPYLVSDRDEVIIEKPKREYRRGDIALYRRDSGIYVLHRIHHVNCDGYYMLGDSQRWIEGPLREEQLLAIVVTLIRNGREISVENTWYKLSYRIWLRLRIFRMKLMKTWRLLRKVCGKKDQYEMPW